MTPEEIKRLRIHANSADEIRKAFEPLREEWYFEAPEPANSRGFVCVRKTNFLHAMNALAAHPLTDVPMEREESDPIPMPSTCNDCEQWMSEVRSARAELAILTAKLTAAQEDSESLDWLEKLAKRKGVFTRIFISNSEDMGYAPDEAISLIVDSYPMERKADKKPTLRTALKAARNATNEGEGRP